MARMKFDKNKPVYNLASEHYLDIIREYDKALMKIAYKGQCNSCDGCGYENGCMDEHCATYIANKVLEKVRNNEKN